MMIIVMLMIAVLVLITLPRSLAAGPPRRDAWIFELLVPSMVIIIIIHINMIL